MTDCRTVQETCYKTVPYTYCTMQPGTCMRSVPVTRHQDVPARRCAARRQYTVTQYGAARRCVKQVPYTYHPDGPGVRLQAGAVHRHPHGPRDLRQARARHHLPDGHEPCVKQVPVTTCRMVGEPASSRCPVTTCRMVAEPCVKRVCETICETVCEQRVKTVPEKICEMQTVQCVKQVPVHDLPAGACVTQTICCPVTVTRQVSETQDGLRAADGLQAGAGRGLREGPRVRPLRAPHAACSPQSVVATSQCDLPCTTIPVCDPCDKKHPLIGCRLFHRYRPRWSVESCFLPRERPRSHPGAFGLVSSR